MKTVGFNIKILGTEGQIQRLGEIEKSLQAVAVRRRELNQTVNEARTYLATYNNDLKRENELYKSGAISQKEYEQTTGRLKELAKSHKQTLQSESAELGKLRAETNSLNVSKRELTNTVKIENQINQLAKTSYIALNDTLAQTRKRYKLLSDAERDSAKGRKMLQKIDDLDKKLKQIDQSMGQYQRHVGMYGREITELERRLEILNRAQQRQVKNNTEGSANYNKNKEAIRRTTDELNRLNAQTNIYNNNSKNTINYNNGLIGSFRSLGAAMGITIGLYSGIRVFGAFEKMDEDIADVIKTTGKLRGEVNELKKELATIDTATNMNDLLGIVQSGGRMAIPEEELFDFAKNVDMVYVALKDELSGNADEIATELAKLTGIFELDEEYGTTAEGIKRVGSAINFLSANTKAQSQYVLESTQRWSGFAHTLGLSIGDTLGYAATLDEFGVNLEMGTTAIQKFMGKIAESPDVYRDLAVGVGMTNAEFENLYKNNPNELFIKILESVQNNEGGFEKLNLVMSQLGLEEERQRAVITALVGDTDKLRYNQKLANEEMERGTSIVSEFNTKNTTLGANVRKIGNDFKNYWYNSPLLDWLRGVSKHVADNSELYGKLLKIIGILTGVYLVYHGTMKVGTFIGNAYHKMLVLHRYAMIQSASAGGGLSAVMVRLNAVMSKNPIGFVLLGITALVGAYYALSNNVKKTITQKEVLNELNQKVIQNTADEEAKIKSLLLVAKDKAQSDENRKKAIEELNRISPEYLGNLKLETINTQEATQAVKDYIQQLRIKAMEEAINSKRAELYRKQIDMQSEYEKKNKKTDSTWEIVKRGVTNSDSFDDYIKNQNEVTNELKVLDDLTLKNQKEFQDSRAYLIEKDMRTLDTWYSEQIVAAKGNQKEIEKINLEWEKRKKDLSKKKYTKPTNDNDNKQTEDSKLEDAREKQLQSIKEQNAKILELQNQLASAELQQLEEGINKKIQLQNKSLDDEIKNLESQIIDKEKLTEKEIEINNLINSVIQEKQKAHQKVIGGIIEESSKSQLQSYISFLKDKTELTEKEKEYLIQAESELKERINDEYKDTTEGKIKELEKVAELEKQIANETISDENKKAKEILSINLKLAEAKYELIKKEIEANGIATEAQLESLRLLYEEIQKFSTGEGDEESDASGVTSFLGKMFNIKDEEAELLIDKALELSETIANKIAESREAQIERELKREQDKLEKAKTQEEKILKSKLDAGLITQNQYEASLNQINEEYDKKKEAVEKKAFERKKKLDTAQALIAGALAVMRILADVPKGDFGISTAIMIAAAGITTLAQVANIQAQQFGEGGITEGKPHSQGGEFGILPNGALVNFEGGEAIINKRSMASNDIIQAFGTPKQIASQINSYRNFGRSFYAESGTALPSFTSLPAPAPIRSNNISIGGQELNLSDETVIALARMINDKKVTVNESDITQAQTTVKEIEEASIWTR